MSQVVCLSHRLEIVYQGGGGLPTPQHCHSGGPLLQLISKLPALAVDGQLSHSSAGGWNSPPAFPAQTFKFISCSPLGQPQISAVLLPHASFP